MDGDDPPDVAFVESSYLFLASEEGERTLRENYETQRKVGANVELLTPEMLKENYPWMNVDDVVLGCRGIFIRECKHQEVCVCHCVCVCSYKCNCITSLFIDVCEKER